MSIEIRPATAGEFPDVVRPIMHYFGRSPSDEFATRFGPIIPPDRIHAAWEDGQVVGSGGVFPFETGIPGGLIRAAGVTLVGVLPTHRRRGIFSDLMRAQIDDVHERGEPLAYLWASEDALYGRFGYGVASFCGSIDLSRDRIAFDGGFEPAGKVRLLDAEEALKPFSEIQRLAASRHPGMFVRSEDWWRSRRLADPEWGREGGGEMVRALLELDGRPAAYALYRLHFSAERGIPNGFTSVIEAVGDSPESTREVWRYLLDIDWMGRVRAHLLPLDHELFLLLRDPRRLRFELRDGLWVRLVDVDAALAARTYKPGEPVVLEVLDEFCPWNAGRYRVGPDGVGRTEAAAELRMPVQALGSAYLGGFGFGELARAGRIEELVDGALDRADTLFRADRYPWCPEIF
ncbi:MAG TPA: GNAT family N-acetyltransferase [Gaiellaceae bacterium]|nr:GNAT family N-acetyltransferase [Gaiellaceae bacterium]